MLNFSDHWPLELSFNLFLSIHDSFNRIVPQEAHSKCWENSRRSAQWCRSQNCRGPEGRLKAIFKDHKCFIDQMLISFVTHCFSESTEENERPEIRAQGADCRNCRLTDRPCSLALLWYISQVQRLGYTGCTLQPCHWFHLRGYRRILMHIGSVRNRTLQTFWKCTSLEQRALVCIGCSICPFRMSC